VPAKQPGPQGIGPGQIAHGPAENKQGRHEPHGRPVDGFQNRCVALDGFASGHAGLLRAMTTPGMPGRKVLLPEKGQGLGPSRPERHGAALWHARGDDGQPIGARRQAGHEQRAVGDGLQDHRPLRRHPDVAQKMAGAVRELEPQVVMDGQPVHDGPFVGPDASGRVGNALGTDDHLLGNGRRDRTDRRQTAGQQHQHPE